VGVNIADRGEYSRTVDDLDRDTDYYFSLCLSYDDDRESGIRCGSTRSFTTLRRQYDEPRFSDQSVSVAGTVAQFDVLVDMEDYNNGQVFLLYGTSEERVVAATADAGFSRIQQAEDELQKRSLDTGLDNRERYEYSERDLAAQSTYYYRFCAEYAAEDQFGRDVQQLTCSDVESFVTR